MNDTRRKSDRKIIIIIILVVVGALICTCSGLIAMSLKLMSPSTQATLTAWPTNTPRPTRTPRPTFTPRPTATKTPFPTLTRFVTKTPTPEPHFEPLIGIWRGIKVYYGAGEEKRYAFEILGGSDDCRTIKQGIYVLYPDGTYGWKDRLYLITSKIFFVMSDDLAKKRYEWEIYYGCP